MNSENYSNWITDSWRDYLLNGQMLAAQEGETDKARIISERIASSVVVEKEDVMPGRIQFYSRVTVFGIEEEEEQSFQIVSDDEAEMSAGTIGISSPLAQALLGTQEGDVVQVVLDSKSNCSYEVTHIYLPFDEPKANRPV